MLSSYRTILQKTSGESLFSLCFGLAKLIPPEVECPSTKNTHFCSENNDQFLQENLLLTDGIQREVARRHECFKRIATQYHNS